MWVIRKQEREGLTVIQVIFGKKGSGKTKQLVTDINEAVKNETGSMVCIEKGTKLR